MLFGAANLISSLDFEGFAHFCKMSFSPLFAYFDIRYPFSLTYANSGLNDILQKCANPSKSKDEIRLAAPNSIKIKLYKALEEIVNFMEDPGTSKT
jgi:hypothetical protein